MILGLDISTTSTGYCILDADGEVIRAGAWETKNKNHYPDVFVKAKYIQENMYEIKAQFPIEKVYIETPFTFFGSGGSSAKTMAILQKFNGIISWLCYDVFQKTPHYFTAQQARKANKITIKKGLDTKKQILDWVTQNTPTLTVEHARHGNPKPKYYDIADAIVIAKAGLEKINESIR